MTVKRFDFYQVSPGKPFKTDQGFLRVPIRATRVGIFKYMMPDGSMRKELRPADEVFNTDSMQTLAGVPLTVLHPKEMVRSTNVKKLQVGWTGDTVQKTDETFLDVPGTISDESTVKAVEARSARGDSQEVSCGYTCDIDETPGVFNGESYDVVQRNIRYNHVALVDRGRAGPQVRLRLDDDQAVLYDENIKLDQQPEKNPMQSITINGKEYKVDAETALAFTKLEAENKAKIEKADAALTELEAVKAENAQIKKDSDGIQARLDSATEDLKKKDEELKTRNDAATLDKMAEERAEVLAVATKVIGADFKKDGKSNDEIKKEVVAKQCPEIKVDEKSAEYLAARFDAISEKVENKKEDGFSTDELRAKIKAKEGTRNDSEEKADSDAARAKYMKESSEAWKQPIGKQFK